MCIRDSLGGDLRAHLRCEVRAIGAGLILGRRGERAVLGQREAVVTGVGAGSAEQVVDSHHPQPLVGGRLGLQDVDPLLTGLVLVSQSEQELSLIHI